ncbi:hypothetical protein GCM10027418_11660 [Mariniluteicoccus endophyticus]
MLEAKWWPVIILPSIGLFMLIAGVTMLVDGRDEAAMKRRHGVILAGVGALLVVTGGLTGALMSV